MFDPVNYSLTRQSTGIISRLAKIIVNNNNGTFEVVTIDDLPQITYTAYGTGDSDFDIDDEVVLTILPQSSTTVAYIVSNKKIFSQSTTVLVGSPTDGSYTDGAVNIYPTDTIADAVDKLNETIMAFHPMAPYLGQPINAVGDGDVTFVFSSNIVLAYISDGNGFYLTNGNENTQKYIYKKGVTHTFKTNSHIRGFITGAIFRLKFESTLISELTISDPSVNESNSHIYFTNARQNAAGKWEKHAHFQLNMDALLPNGGWFNINFEQEVEGNLYTDTISGFFDAHQDVLNNALSISLNISSISTTYLSGVNFIRSGNFNVITNMSNLFYEAHVANSLVLNLTGMGCQNKTYTRSDFVPIKYDDVVSKSYVADINEISIQSAGVSGSSTGTNAFNSVTRSASSNVMINTYNTQSTENNDYFRDEFYRLPDGTWNSLPVSLTGQWNSNISLLSNNGLQVLNGLFYPKVNYSVYLPSGNPDYSIADNNRVYIRSLKLSVTPRTNGTITINGMDFNQLGSTWEAYVKLPGLTGWLNLWEPFDVAFFTGADGQGIHVSHTASSITYSTGSFSTGGTDYTIIIKIMMKRTCNLILTRIMYS
jgi:hypothetical protein